MSDDHNEFMRRAIKLAGNAIDNNDGGPFGSVIVKDGKIVGEGWNRVTSSNDPTAHAEIVAIRNACSKLNSFQLEGCTIYTSCEPCPMCLGAIYWARPSAVFFAGTREDAADAGFDDDLIYRELNLPNDARQMRMTPFMRDEARRVFEGWKNKSDKTEY